MESPNKQLARQFLQALGTCDVDLFKKVLHKDVVASAKGKSAMAGDRTLDVILDVAGLFKQVIPGGLNFEVLNLTEEGNRVACECKGNAVLPDGTRYDNEYHFLFFIQDGQIIRVNEYFCSKLAEDVLLPYFMPKA